MDRKFEFTGAQILEMGQRVYSWAVTERTTHLFGVSLVTIIERGNTTATPIGEMLAQASGAMVGVYSYGSQAINDPEFDFINYIAEARDSQTITRHTLIRSKPFEKNPYPLTAIIGRMMLDKFIDELGGDELMQAVMAKQKRVEQSPRICSEKISAAFKHTKEYILRHAPEIVSELDKFMNVDSSNGESADDMARNALSVINHFSLSGTEVDQIKFLAKVRIALMRYPEFCPEDAHFSNHSHRGALRRISFDKMLDEIGGKELTDLVLRKAAEIMPLDHAYVPANSR